ncbi:MAG: hypothetical protein LKG56_08625 [Lachnospiraceae bacterium]|jgi:hypothetical protein|nr:hypothetical protein [Lachnospiraceae bacterium]MCH4032184.1 hypothetical protein [Lachnospiraceae bacterium]MCH4108938.1 hypothetical protein [Lachnospiraceae bacterium]MCI1332340.1 hypothetical protein [Lachnospiraceae bacterium]MCI1361709.1 hypothetical protein [Lachnospiraceae bacterium]
MSTHVCAVFDRDQLYARRLAGALSSRRDLPFYVKLFTGKEELCRYLQAESPEVLLVGEDGCNDDIRRLYSGNLLRLLEEPAEKSGADEPPGICKYQSFSSFVRQMMGYCGQTLLPVSEEISIFGFYSFLPAQTASCLAALSAWRLGAGDERGGRKALFLNLDEFSCLLPMLPAVSGKTISDAVYAYRQDESRYGGKLAQMTGENAWFWYLAPFLCAEDCAQMQPAELPGFFRATASALGVNTVVVDIGQAFPRVWELFPICDTVFIAEDESSSGRVDALARYLAASGREDGLERIVRLPFPDCRLPDGAFAQPPSADLRKQIPAEVSAVRERTSGQTNRA